MNLRLTLRWIGGIVASAFLTLGLAIALFHHAVNIDMAHPTVTEFWISNVVLSLAFGLFLFCACWFVPAWKRNAGIVALVFSVLFIGFGIYNHITYDGYLHKDHIIRYTSFILAMVAALAISYKAFGGHKWRNS